MNRIVLMSIVLGSAMSSSTSRAQSIICGPAYRNTTATQPQVLILRPRVTIWKQTLLSKSESEGTAEAVQAGFHGLLSRTFEEKGYSSRIEPSAMAQWEETAPNDEAIKALWDDYDSLFSPPYRPDCRKILRTSLQGDLKKLTGSNDFDAVVLVRADGTVLTKAAAAVTYPWGPDRDLSFSISVVDGKSGRFLYYCKSSAPRKYIDEPDLYISGPARKCLKPYFSAAKHH